MSHKLTHIQIQWLCAKREGGSSLKFIADKLNVCTATVAYHCQKQSAIPPRGLNSRSKRPRIDDKTRDQIYDLAGERRTPYAIASILNLPPSTVNYHVRRHALETTYLERQQRSIQ